MSRRGELTARDAEIFDAYTGGSLARRLPYRPAGVALIDLAAEYGISRECARQIISRERRRRLASAGLPAAEEQTRRPYRSPP